MPRSKTFLFWAGVSSVMVGVIFAAYGIWGTIHERTADQDLDSMVGDLRANGAIVENYYKVVRENVPKTQPTHQPLYYIIAGIFVVGGVSMIIVSRKMALSGPAAIDVSAGGSD